MISCTLCDYFIVYNFPYWLWYIIYRVTDTAAKQLTKTAITVTAIFIIALGYDLWYYVLGYSGITEYKMNSPLQKLGKRLPVFWLLNGNQILISWIPSSI